MTAAARCSDRCPEQELIIGDAAHVMLSNTLNTFLIKSGVKGLEVTPQDTSYPGQMTSLLNVTVER